MDNSDSAPDSWEQADIDAPEAQLNSSLARLNVNAKPFIPNVHAAEFVPSFLIKSSAAVDGLQDEGKDCGMKGQVDWTVSVGAALLVGGWVGVNFVEARLGLALSLYITARLRPSSFDRSTWHAHLCPGLLNVWALCICSFRDSKNSKEHSLRS